MTIFRYAGHNERRCIMRESLGLYGTIVILGTYTGPSQGSMSIASLRSKVSPALQQTIIQHPALGTVVKGADAERPQLARAEFIDLDHHLQIVEYEKHKENAAQDLQTLLQYIHNQPLPDANTPQWRVFVAPLQSTATTCRFNLAFACSHALWDGVSASLFHTSLLRALRDIDEAKSNHSLIRVDSGVVMTATSEEVLPPPFDKAANLSLSWKFLLLGPLVAEFLPTAIARMVGASIENANKAWFGAPKRPARPAPGKIVQTAVEVTIIESDVVKKALIECKRHNARLTGLINRLTARALAIALRARGQDYEHFMVDTAMDMRRCLPESRDKMINYVAAHNELLTIRDTPDVTSPLTSEDWQAVRKTTDSLSEASGRLSNQPVALLKLLKDCKPYVLKKASTRAEGSFISSNLGTFDGISAGPAAPARIETSENGWKIEQMAFSQSANGTGPPFNMNVASAKGGAMVLIMTWWPGMLGVDGKEDEKVFARELCDGVVSQLKAVASQ